MSTHHIIRQQYLDVELNGDESDGLALQRRLSGLCEHRLTPAVERVLDRCAPLEGHLYIEQLEIEAGTLALERLEHDLAAAVAEALEKALREQALPDEAPSIILSRNVNRKTAHLSVHEAFIFFLKTGSLPWSFRLSAGCTLEQVILNSLHEAMKSGVALRTVSEAVHQVLASATARTRLVRQFSTVFLETLLSLLSPKGQTALNEVLPTVRNSNEPTVELKSFERYLWETAFAHIAAGRIPSAMDLATEAWRALPATVKKQSELASVLERHWPEVTRKDSGTANSSSRPPEADERLPVGEGIYIENAGLVLLHPFLQRFFTALGITAEDKLLQPERALCLLHFLATGRTIAPEHELTLPKILCNVPLETPAESDVALTVTEQEEAIALLEAVIRHWTVLRNTSPDGLRGTFLLRPGKVSMRGNDWLLQVESRTSDILLDHLPWGISMVKLPWMEKMVWVEWK